MLFAKLASPSCRWLDGEVAVELFADDDADATRVRVLTELGGGQRERVLPPISIPFSGHPSVLEDLTDVAARTPSLLGPLRLERVSSRCVLLVASGPDETPLSCEFPISDSCMASLDTDGVDVDLDASWDRSVSN